MSVSSIGAEQEGPGSTGQQMQEKVQHVTEQAQSQVQEARERASSRVREQVDQRSSQWGDQVRSTADDLRSVAEELRTKDKAQPAKLAEQAAARVDSLGRYLSESDADKILRDVEDLARRQPWMVIALGAGLGLLASRFLKASSSQRYQSRYGGHTPQYTSTRSRAELRESVGTPVVTATPAAYSEPAAVPPIPPHADPRTIPSSYTTDPYGGPQAPARGGSTSEL
jgi:ElaB/YqjD/DUF883 family membrane-anchored ribosome-binding protein